jgi:signal transduction protein with GAF and PtsI domain
MGWPRRHDCLTCLTSRRGRGRVGGGAGVGGVRTYTNDVAEAVGGPDVIGSSMEHDNLVKVLAEFAHTLTCGYEITDVLYRLADSVVDVLEAAGAGVSLADDGGHLHAVTSINALSAAIEAAEEAFQQGPCIEAFRDGRSIAIGDLGSMGSSWPAYSTVAREHGVVSVLAVPVAARNSSMGSLNVYSIEARSWSNDTAVAETFADMAASYLLHASELDRAQRTAEQLQRALDRSRVIEQAKGVLANEYNVSVDEAYNILRHHARSHNANLASTADAIVLLGLRPPRR